MLFLASSTDLNFFSGFEYDPAPGWAAIVKVKVLREDTNYGTVKKRTSGRGEKRRVLCCSTAEAGMSDVASGGGQIRRGICSAGNGQGPPRNIGASSPRLARLSRLFVNFNIRSSGLLSSPLLHTETGWHSLRMRLTSMPSPHGKGREHGGRMWTYQRYRRGLRMCARK